MKFPTYLLVLFTGLNSLVLGIKSHEKASNWFTFTESLHIFEYLFDAGFESGKEYMYKAVVRSVSGVNALMNGRNAVIEMQSRVIVQVVDANTLIVKFSDSRIRHYGNYQGNVFNTTEKSDGGKDPIAGYEYEFLSAPFSVSHNTGFITGVKIGAGENKWIVNLKKSFARQLQLDVTGIRRENLRSCKSSYHADNEDWNSIIFEDFMNGSCETKINITPLPTSTVHSCKANNSDSLQSTCGDSQVYGIVKMTDFNKCKTNFFWDSTTYDEYTSDFDSDDFSERYSESKYVACENSLSSELTMVQGETYSSLVPQSVARGIDRKRGEESATFTITNIKLENQKEITHSFKVGSYTKEHKKLAYDFNFFEQWKHYESFQHPHSRNSFPESNPHRNILDALRLIDQQTQKRTFYEKDKSDRLAVISHRLRTFSYSELRSLWQDVKTQDYNIVSLFVDCLVRVGRKASIVLLKEMIKTEEITGRIAKFSLFDLGYYVETPSREILYHFVDLLKSTVVRSSKELLQIGLMAVSDLFSNACGSRRTSASKLFRPSSLEDFCDSKNSTIIIKELLILIVDEFGPSRKVYDRIRTLIDSGSLEIEEVVDHLLSIIRTSEKTFDSRRN